MPLGNREGNRSREAESEYLANVLYKELRYTANCDTLVDEFNSPFFVQLYTRKEIFYEKQ